MYMHPSPRLYLDLSDIVPCVTMGGSILGLPITTILAIADTFMLIPLGLLIISFGLDDGVIHVNNGFSSIHEWNVTWCQYCRI